MKLHYNPPSVIKRFFNQFYWDTVNSKIMLTFDDGPNRVTTEKILSELNRLNIKALFFCVGNNVDRYEELVKQILEEGHTIGNHTYNHNIITSLETENAQLEIIKCSSTLLDNFNYVTDYFRPPHGKFNFKTKRIIVESGLRCVMWSLLTYDYQNDFKKVKFAVDNYLTKNSIIILHDSNKSKNIIIDSINYIVDKVHEKDFQFGEARECLK